MRHYRTDPVPSDIVQRIVRVVRRAPSAGFSQGHRVVVVTEPDLRQRIADLGESWYLDAAGFGSPADPDELLALGRPVHLPDVATIGVLTVGYSAEDPATRNARFAQRRKPIDELVRWQRY